MRVFDGQLLERPDRATVLSAEIRRALLKVGFRTPFGRDPGDWLDEDPPTWEWPIPPDAAVAMVRIGDGPVRILVTRPSFR